MKKLFTPIFFMFVVSAVYGQRIGFTWNGEQLGEGASVTVPVEAEDYGGGFFIVEGSTNSGSSNLQLVNSGSTTANVTVVGKVTNSSTPSAVTVQLCAGGDCTRDTQGTGRIEKKASLGAGASVPARWEVDFGNVDNYGEVETILSMTAGTTTVSVNVTFVYGATGITRPAETEHSTKEPIFDLLGRRIRPHTPMAPGIYIIGGRKVVVK